MSNTSLELAVRTQTALTDLKDRTQARLAEERGQTAAEYMGLLLIVALLIAAVLASGIQKELTDGVKKALTDIRNPK